MTDNYLSHLIVIFGTTYLSSASSNPNLTMPLIIKYIDKMNWSMLALNPNLTPQFIDMFITKFEFGMLSQNPGLTRETLHKYREQMVWGLVSLKVKLTPELINEFYDFWNWKWLSMNKYLTPEMIETHQDKLDWHILTANRALTLPLIEKYWDRIDQKNLINNPNLTLEFLKKWQTDDTDFRKLLENSCLNPEILAEFENRMGIDWIHKTPEMIEQHLENELNQLCLTRLCANPGLTPDFLVDYLGLNQETMSPHLQTTLQRCWLVLSRNPNITLQFILKNAHKLDVNELFFNEFSLHPVVIKRKLEAGIPYLEDI